MACVSEPNILYWIFISFFLMDGIQVGGMDNGRYKQNEWIPPETFHKDIDCDTQYTLHNILPQHPQNVMSHSSSSGHKINDAHVIQLKVLSFYVLALEDIYVTAGCLTVIDGGFYFGLYIL